MVWPSEEWDLEMSRPNRKFEAVNLKKEDVESLVIRSTISARLHWQLEDCSSDLYQREGLSIRHIGLANSST